MDGFDESEKKYGELAEWVSLAQLDDIEIISSKDFRTFIKQALNEVAR
jgi:hypothetical protein